LVRVGINGASLRCLRVRSMRIGVVIEVDAAHLNTRRRGEFVTSENGEQRCGAETSASS
jgi:hypothetical protein